MIKKFAKELKISDFVLQRVLNNKRNPNDGKLGLNYEDYQIYHETDICICKIQSLQGQQLNCSWNVTEFKDIIHWGIEKYIVD